MKKSFTKERINQATKEGAAFGVRVTHINFKATDNKGGITVAYKMEHKHSQILELATAICSDKDQFDKSIGRTLAIERFLDGKTISVPYSKQCFDNPVQAINSFFESCHYK